MNFFSYGVYQIEKYSTIPTSSAVKYRVLTEIMLSVVPLSFRKPSARGYCAFFRLCFYSRRRLYSSFIAYLNFVVSLSIISAENTVFLGTDTSSANTLIRVETQLLHNTSSLLSTDVSSGSQHSEISKLL